jgi:hypothetical protein
MTTCTCTTLAITPSIMIDTTLIPKHLTFLNKNNSSLMIDLLQLVLSNNQFQHESHDSGCMFSSFICGVSWTSRTYPKGNNYELKTIIFISQIFSPCHVHPFKPTQAMIPSHHIFGNIKVAMKKTVNIQNL